MAGTTVSAVTAATSGGFGSSHTSDTGLSPEAAVGMVQNRLISKQEKLTELQEKESNFSEKIEYFTTMKTEADTMRPNEVAQVRIVEWGKNMDDPQFSTKRFVAPSEDKINGAFESGQLRSLDPIGSQLRDPVFIKTMEASNMLGTVRSSINTAGAKMTIPVQQYKVGSYAAAKDNADELAKTLIDSLPAVFKTKLAEVRKDYMTRLLKDRLMDELWQGDDKTGKPKTFNLIDLPEKLAEVIKASAKAEYETDAVGKYTKPLNKKEIDKEGKKEFVDNTFTQADVDTDDKKTLVKDSLYNRPLDEKETNTVLENVLKTLDQPRFKKDKDGEPVQQPRTMPDATTNPVMWQRMTETFQRQADVELRQTQDAPQFIGADFANPEAEDFVGACPRQLVGHMQVDENGYKVNKPIYRYQKFKPGEALSPFEGHVGMEKNQKAYYADSQLRLFKTAVRGVRSLITVIQQQVSYLQEWLRGLQQMVGGIIREITRNPYQGGGQG